MLQNLALKIAKLKEMENEEQQQKNHVENAIVLPQPEQVDYDHDLALSLQNQEEDVTMLEASESEEEEEEEEDEDEDEESIYSSSSTESDHPNFFTSQELAEFELLEQEEQEELEDDIIEDEEESELTYEDLVALGEEVGHENQGLSPEEIPSTLSPYICKSIESNTGIERCVICQVDYEEGEELVNLRCDHPFHESCIKQWLQIKKTCPICSKEAIKEKTE